MTNDHEGRVAASLSRIRHLYECEARRGMGSGAIDLRLATVLAHIDALAACRILIEKGIATPDEVFAAAAGESEEYAARIEDNHHRRGWKR